MQENRKRKIVDEKLHTCGCLPENLERIVSNWDSLIELLSHCIKKGGVSRRRGVGIGCESNSPIAIVRGSKGMWLRAFGLFRVLLLFIFIFIFFESCVY